MTAMTHIEDHFVATVEPSILEQYRDAERWKSSLKAVIEKLQVVEDAAFELSDVISLKEVPTGYRLDWLAGLLNVVRIPGESDNDFFSRFIASLGNNTAGTPDNVIYNAAILSGDSAPQYMDEAPATFFVYTGPRRDNGSGTVCTEGADQLYARQVRRMAPAGVLGLVGASVQVGGAENSEELLADADGRVFLMVASDDTVERTLVLVDDNARPVVTPQNVAVRAVVKGTTVPTIPVTLDGNRYDGVRIKDLPDGDTGYMVRDSETGGTVKTKTLTGAEMELLWEDTPAEEEDDGE